MEKNAVGKSGKRRNITRSDSSIQNQLTNQAIKEHKEKIGEVILVRISKRTTIELPANLTPEERNARIENYKKLHNSNV